MDLQEIDQQRRRELWEQAIGADPRLNVFNADDIVWLLDLLNEKDSEIELLYEQLAGEDL